MRGSLIAIWLLLCPASYAFVLEEAQAQQVGKFVGRLVAEWLDDGRNMRLVRTFGYRGADQTNWVVPKGTVVNGASIPRFLWSFVGGPFADKYRKASVIHDYYCEQRNRSWQKVHKIFHEAMLASGVERGKAWILYKAVERFGPRWEPRKGHREECKRVNGRIDFESCARNERGNRPAIVHPPQGADEVRRFVNEMKNSQFPEAARQLERAILK